jgi:phosphate/phosphite/phosphonate ABC transporter binding protein
VRTSQSRNRCLGVSAVVVALSCAAGAQEPKPTTLAFGVYAYKRPADVYREFAPGIDAMNHLLAQDGGPPVTVELKIYRTYEECLDIFVHGKVDLVRFGPASYVMAKARAPGVQILAIEQEGGQKFFKGVIAVRQDSPVKALSDLKGRTFAFGDENSTIGRFLSQAELVRAGIHASDLKAFKYLDRHDRVFKAVEMGDYDAGAMHINTFRSMNKENKLRTLVEFDNLGKPWLARTGLDPAMTKRISGLLLHLKDAKVLKALKVNGFLPCTDKDFDFVRKGMKLSEGFVQQPEVSTPQPAPPGSGKD